MIVVWEAVKGGIDAPGVAGEDGLQGVGHALVGGTQAGAHRGDWGTICRLTAAAVMGGSPEVDRAAISAGQSCAITPLIAHPFVAFR